MKMKHSRKNIYARFGRVVFMVAVGKEDIENSMFGRDTQITLCRQIVFVRVLRTRKTNV